MWVEVKAIRLDEITKGEDRCRKEKSSKEWPSEISPALNPASAAGQKFILMLEELALFLLVPDG